MPKIWRHAVCSLSKVEGSYFCSLIYNYVYLTSIYLCLISLFTKIITLYFLSPITPPANRAVGQKRRLPVCCFLCNRFDNFKRNKIFSYFLPLKENEVTPLKNARQPSKIKASETFSISNILGFLGVSRQFHALFCFVFIQQFST